ncbi:MAG: SRPBCC family protein [Deltaproteobacteria bacterium]|nr:SRPBCC family protein [Deltaproteobacteria bacterium]
MADANADLLTTHVERIAPNELQIRRAFRAKPQTVFNAMTNPELLKRWWAPCSLGVILHSAEADVRVGGRYRYVFGKAGEPTMAFNGRYLEVEPGARVVYTQVFEPMPQAGEGIITSVYAAHPLGTLFTQNERFPSKEVLDGVLASGMERGMRETLDQLAELVPTL